MDQLRLPMLTVYEGPRLVDLERVRTIKTFRDAVRACWELRTRRSLTKRQLAEEVESYAPHVTDYLHEDDDPKRRDLPAKRIPAFEIACGNRLITQWLAMQAGGAFLDEARVAVLEQLQQLTRRVA